MAAPRGKCARMETAIKEERRTSRPDSLWETGGVFAYTFLEFRRSARKEQRVYAEATQVQAEKGTPPDVASEKQLQGLGFAYPATRPFIRLFV